MDERRIKSLVSELDEAVPRNDARVLLQVYGGGPDESQIVATATGYLRLGIELMKAGVAPASPDAAAPASVPVDLAYLVQPGSSIHFDWFERRDPEVTPEVSDKTGRRLAFVFLSVLALIAGLAIIGAIALARMALSW